MAAKFFIINIKLNFRGHWASGEDGTQYQITPNGVLVLELKLINGESGDIIPVNVDILYCLKEEAEALMENKFLKGRVVRKLIHNKLLGRETPVPYQAGWGYKLPKDFTRQIRREIFGEELVPVSWRYINKLKNNYLKKKKEGRVPKNSTYLELKPNPRFRVKEWVEALVKYSGV